MIGDLIFFVVVFGVLSIGLTHAMIKDSTENFAFACQEKQLQINHSYEEMATESHLITLK